MAYPEAYTGIKPTEIDQETKLIPLSSIQPIDFGKSSWDILVDLPNKKVIKRLIVLRNFYAGLTEIETEADFQAHLNRSVFLKHPDFGLSKMIPDWSFKTYFNQGEHRTECLIEMPYIKGVPLSRISEVPEDIALQLAQFLICCQKMAKATKGSTIPDLLGGTKHPKDKFMNFVVEDGTNKLFFVDVYPLIDLKWYHPLRNIDYKHKLANAAGLIGNPAVISATKDLITSL